MNNNIKKILAADKKMADLKKRGLLKFSKMTSDLEKVHSKYLQQKKTLDEWRTEFIKFGWLTKDGKLNTLSPSKAVPKRRQ